MASAQMKELVIAFGPEGSSSAPAISVGHVYVFRLYSIALGRRLLARLTIGRGRPIDVVVALAPVPKTTSSAVNRLLQLVPFGWIAVFAVLGGLYAREVWHRG